MTPTAVCGGCLRPHALESDYGKVHESGSLCWARVSQSFSRRLECMTIERDRLLAEHARAHAEGKAEGLREALEIHQNMTLTRKETIARLCALLAPHLPAGEERE